MAPVAERGPLWCEGPAGRGGLYHSRAAHEEWDGAFPLQKDTSDGVCRKQGGTVERTASPLNFIRGEAFLFCPQYKEEYP